MSTPHRATEEQWEIVEICREEGHTPWPTATCLLELRSRIDHLERALLALTSTVTSAGHDHRRHIEALEQRPIPPMAEVAADPAPAIEPPPLDVPQGLAYDWINRHGIFRPVHRLGSDWKERTGTDWGMVITEAARWGQRQGWDARGATTGLAERQAPPPLRCPGAHTIAECGGPCEDDFRLCDCGLLQQLNPAPSVKDSLTDAPARSLVERLAWIIEPDDPLVWRGTCGLILREVAAWLRENDSKHEMGGDAAATADLIEHEASR